MSVAYNDLTINTFKYNAIQLWYMVEKQNVSIRLETDKLAEIEAIAKADYIPTSTMMRQWVLQRLEIESKKT